MGGPGMVSMGNLKQRRQNRNGKRGGGSSLMIPPNLWWICLKATGVHSGGILRQAFSLHHHPHLQRKTKQKRRGKEAGMSVLILATGTHTCQVGFGPGLAPKLLHLYAIETSRMTTGSPRTHMYI